MTLRQLESFLAIVRTGSFAGAAERLCVTQSTISARISELEQFLGVELFDRTQRSARLTMKGRELVGCSEQILNLADDIKRRIGTNDVFAGVLRIGVAELVAISWLPVFVNMVRKKFPSMTLEFEVGLNPSLFEGIKNGLLDIAVVAGDVSDPGMEVCHINPVHFAWMASAEFFQDSPIVTLAQLSDSPILYQGTSSYTNSVMDGLLQTPRKDRKSMTCNSLEAIVSLARAGVGIAFLPQPPHAQHVNYEGIRVLNTAEIDYHMPFSIIHHKTDSLLIKEVNCLCRQASEVYGKSISPLPCQKKLHDFAK